MRCAREFFTQKESMHTTAPASTTLENHLQQMDTLGTSLASFLNSQRFHHEVVMSVLLTTYANWAVAHPDVTMAASRLTGDLSKHLALQAIDTPAGRVH